MNIPTTSSATKPSFVYVIYINTTPEKLWTALTNDQVIPRYWFGNAVRSSWTPGQPIQSFDKDDNSLDWDGEILESEPPNKLVFTFHVVGRDEAASKVTYLIEPVQQPPMGPTGKAVKFTVIHDDFPADSQIVHGISQGWPGIISSLKTLLESGDSLNLTWTAPSDK